MEQYTIKMNNFEGPLDLLCHLIDKNKMDIFDIKINDITDQYIEYLSYMKQMNLKIMYFMNLNMKNHIKLKEKVKIDGLLLVKL